MSEKAEIGKRGQSSDSQNYMALYHSSEEVKNKLLLEVQTIRVAEAEKLRAAEVRLTQEHNKHNNCRRSLEQLIIEVDSYRKEIQEISRACQQEKRMKLRLKQEHDASIKAIQKEGQ